MFRLMSCFVVLVLIMSMAQAVEIETVPVGHLGNLGELSGSGAGGIGPDRVSGAVDYAYNIGKYEVTAGQYTEFLNAVAKTDSFFGLYNPNMDTDDYGCQITRNGSSGNYTYDFSGRPSGKEADWVDRPVNYVSWYNAAMFANWLTSGDIHHGVYGTRSFGFGSTNASSYTEITPRGSAAMDTLVAAYGKVWVIPTEDEWYKASYHKNDGDTGNYFVYPTSSNSAPGYVDNAGKLSGTSTVFVDGVADPGNYTTYDGDGGTNGIGPDYYRTEVGEWENSGSPYGTFDQGGNLWEWNETLSDSYRGLRGGSFSYDGALYASYGLYDMPTVEYYYAGFRVASVPEPSTLVLLAMGAIGMLAYARRRRK